MFIFGVVVNGKWENTYSFAVLCMSIYILVLCRYFERHRIFLEYKFSCIKKLLLLDVVLYAIYEILGHIVMPLPVMVIFKSLKIVLAVMLCLTVYMISYLVATSNIMASKIFEVLRRDSLGIYLYSDPFNYLILACGVTVFGGELWTSNVYSAGLYLFRIFFTLSISILVTEFIRMCRIKYIC